MLLDVLGLLRKPYGVKEVPGPLRRPEDNEGVMRELLAAAPTCIVHRDGRLECWGSREKLEKVLKSLAKGLPFVRSPRLPEDLDERVRRAAEAIAEKLKAGETPEKKWLEKLAKENKVYIFIAHDQSRGAYVVSPP